MPVTESMLVLKNVSKRYAMPGNPEGLAVLSDVSLEVSTGETLAIIGPSGSGKSTLLNIIGTLDRPSSGEVTLAGQNLTQLDDLQLAKVRNRSIGFIFQSHHLLPQCTVLENVLVPVLADKTISRSEAATRARKLLERVGLTGRISHRPGQLSGGERQRVAVVRALINQPKLLLADEPTGALDHTSSSNMAKLLTELNREEKTAMIVVTHSLDLARLMNREFELTDGRLKATR